MKHTRLLRIVFETYKKTLTPEEYFSFEEHIDSMIQKIVDELKCLPTALERGQWVQALIDDEVEKNMSAKVSCHNGCSSCCHFNVEITSDDVAVLIEGIKQSSPPVNYHRLADQGGRIHRDPKWTMGPIPSNRCVFLSDKGSCQVYAYRPAVCRKAIVTSDPKECFDINGNVVPVFMPTAEIIISAALNLEGSRLGSLPILLHEELQTKDQTPLADLAL